LSKPPNVKGWGFGKGGERIDPLRMIQQVAKMRWGVEWNERSRGEKS
jgi:hypothetical protein